MFFTLPAREDIGISINQDKWENDEDEEEEVEEEEG